MNVYSILTDAIRRHRDETALCWADRTLTYGALDRVAASVGEHYRALGCERGDRVLLFLRNSFEFPILMLAAIRAGFVVVPVNAKLHPREVAWIYENSGARLIITHEEHVEPLREAVAGNEPRFITIEAFTLPQGSDLMVPPVDVDPDDPAWIFYTSGTTGKPKGATLTHRNLIAASVNCLADIFDFRASDRVLHVAPLSHGSGLYLIPSLARGAENVISDRANFQPDEVLAIVSARGITALAFVAPTMIVRLLDAGRATTSARCAALSMAARRSTSNISAPRCAASDRSFTNFTVRAKRR